MIVVWQVSVGGAALAHGCRPAFQAEDVRPAARRWRFGSKLPRVCMAALGLAMPSAERSPG